ncbi:serine/threonine-protein kinase [Tabrizicola sp.]|uniref:serine/threonine protein kinase n=1 Tax=Tabrizicola sp. TaxID=2005166 RepID=UPI002735157B|nr:serine/threonine-protein kinase [Tabrizicola sp.]MDP3197939.1 protein kinase [Tabrizicola sp.]
MAQQKVADPVEEADDLIDELQPGAKLLKGQYTITRYINSGGFGITYLAKDSLDRDVVIKECFPSSVCRRSKIMVAARSRAHTAELRSVIQLFVREARNLAKIVHPNIVAVHQVFEDNGTAYMAIDFIDGLDLQQIIDGEGEMLQPEHIVRITDKLLAAVGFIHDHDMLHRDISPDNVLINKAGEPILIDFGAAREHASKTTRAMSALRVVKDGYSPQEFYIAGSEQGPWSDLYALGATLYHLISGEAPVNGQARLAALAEERPDPYLPLTGRFAGYPAGFLEAIDCAMSALPKQRVQTASDWLAMYHKAPGAPGSAGSVDDAVHRLVSEFQSGASAEGPKAPAKAVSQPLETVPALPPVARGRSPVQLVAGIAVALVVVAGGYVMLGKSGAPAGDTAAAAGSSQTATRTAIQSSEPAATGTATLETASAALLTPEVAPTAPVEPAASSTATSDLPASGPAADPLPTEQAAAPPAPADDGETTAAEVTETAVLTATAAEPADTPVAPVVAASSAPEVAAEPVVAAETVAAVAEAAPAPVAGPKPAASQVAFAVWDVELPFTADDRVIGGQPLTIVQRLSPGLDRAATGGWLQQGLLIYAVNGKPTPTAKTLTTVILNAMQVDPDGKARVVVEYAGSDLQKKIDLLTVDAVRIISLANGVSARTSVVDGVWKTEITTVARPETTTLKPGDTLFRDKTTTTPLDEATSLEKVLAALVDTGVTETEFSIIRDSKVAAATMRLVPDGGQ